MRDAIVNRISRRTFEKIPLSSSEKDAIMRLVESANEASELTITFIEDGSDAFSSLQKSYGMFSGVRSMLLMKGRKSDSNLREKVGYYGEDIVLNLTDMGLGTCWVGGTYDREQLEFADDEELVCVIVLGKVKKSTLKEKVLRSVISKKRKPIEERLLSSVEIPEWLRNGMEAVRLAPTAKNAQKPTFHFDGITLTADVVDDYAMDMVDLGIAKKHFELTVGGTFELGNGAYFIHYKEKT